MTINIRKEAGKMHDRTEFSTVVGIFKDRINAEQASDELRRASFNYDQVELLAPGMERSEAGSIKDYLISISMPEEKAIRYHNEFKNGCILIMVNVIDRYQEVLAI